MDRWQGRVAIVTGASAGIGKAIAKLLAEHGMRVIAAARRMDRLKELCSETKGEIYAVECDVTKEEDVIRVVKWTRENFGGADVLVNNAGVGPKTPLIGMDTAMYNAVVNTNLFGLLIMTREVIRDMRERGVDDGHIFHINSISGQYIISIPQNNYVYTAIKHAVTVATEGLRRELRDAKSKMKITSISPGFVRTEIAVAAGLRSPEENEKFYNSMICLEPIDIAEALRYALATPPHVQVHEISINPVQQVC